VTKKIVDSLNKKEFVEPSDETIEYLLVIYNLVFNFSSS